MGGLGRLTLAKWAGCSAVQVGSHVKCGSRSNDLSR